MLLLTVLVALSAASELHKPSRYFGVHGHGATEEAEKKCGRHATDLCPDNPLLTAPSTLGLPDTTSVQQVADAVWSAFNGASQFPIVISWNIPFPKPPGSVASVASLSRGPPPFRFNLAGALLTQVRIVYYSLCEYLIEVNSPSETSGYGGRYPGVEFQDRVLRGSVSTFTDQQLEATLRLPGDIWTTTATPQGVPQGYGFGERGGLFLERALFPNAQSGFSLLQFGIILPVSFLSNDFVTAYEQTCQVATNVLLNIVASVAAGALQAQQLTPGTPQQQQQAACGVWYSITPLINSTWCGYDLVELLRVRYPTQVGAVTALCPSAPPTDSALSTDPQLRFQALLAQFGGLASLAGGNSPLAQCNDPTRFFVKNSFAPVTQPTCSSLIGK
jgi:hypothetical protein